MNGIALIALRTEFNIRQFIRLADYRTWIPGSGMGNINHLDYVEICGE